MQILLSNEYGYCACNNRVMERAWRTYMVLMHHDIIIKLVNIIIVIINVLVTALT